MYTKGPISHIIRDCPSYPDLTTIDLSNKRVSSLEQTLPSIISLNNKLNDNKIQILANDNHLINLKGISIVSQKLASIKIHNNHLKNVQGIQNLNFPYIQKLYLEYNEIQDLSGIQTTQFPRLIRLTINSNKLTSQKVQILKKLNAPQLRVLGLDNNKIKSIEFIAQIKLSHIIDINLSNNQIQDITPLKYCIFITKLSKIQLQNNHIYFIPNINSNLYNLRKLTLSNNKIQTVQGLISCQFPNLQVLQIQNNLLTNIQFMYRLHAPKIIDIKLSKNKIIRITNKTLRYCYLPVLEQLLLKNNMITGNLIEQLMISFCDVGAIREEFLKQFISKDNTTDINTNTNINNNNNNTNTNTNTKIIKTIPQKKTSTSSSNQNYNDNKTFSMFSCWRNQLIIKKQQQVYTKLKHHFDKLSYLQF